LKPETFQAQIAQLYTQIETMGRTNALRMENAHKGTVLLTNRSLETSHQLLTAITNKNFKESDEILEQNIKDNAEYLAGLKKNKTSNYTPTGDKDIDTVGEQKNELDVDVELQNWLQGEIDRAGYNLSIQLVPNFPDAQLNGNLITMGTGFSQEDSYRLLIHELAHYESGSVEHGEEFMRGKEEVIRKLKGEDKKTPIYPKKSPPKPTQHKINLNRGLDILTAFFTDDYIDLTVEEYDYLNARGAIRDGKPYFKDETHAINILQLR